MKYSHEKANEIRQSVDPSGKIYNNIQERIKNTLNLFSFSREEGAKISYGNRPYKGISDTMSNKIVTVAEIINNLSDNNFAKSGKVNFTDNIEKNNNEEVFDLILGNLFRGIVGYDEQTVEKIIGEVEEIYGLE